MLYPGLIRKYKNYLPVAESSVVTLHEGNTPLFESKGIVKHYGLSIRLFFKLEGLNPTGSFKDRGMTYAVSKAHEAGFRAVICASTGNTSASAAAYAARAGMQALVVIPRGKIALGKLAQAQVHGAKVFQIDGNFDDALKIVREVAEHPHVMVVNSINPHRLLGQETAAYEIVEALGEAPDFHFIPVGNAGNIVAHWRGYKRCFQEGNAKQLPRMCGFQAAGAAPIVKREIVKNPETVASAIRIGNPASWDAALDAAKSSRGFIAALSDSEILAAYRDVAHYDGYFCEPASAASLAGVIKLAQRKFFQKDQTVVCTLTGHGLKDPDTAKRQSPPPFEIPASAEEILRHIS